MKIASLRRYLAVALPMVGSAILLFSCGAEVEREVDVESYESMMTEYSENLSIIMSNNGLKSYHFTSPLMEGYAMAHDPYKEFRKGIKIVMFEDDEKSSVSATLTANYAIFYENRKLWEAKGDVVVIQSGGRRLYTSQLFWNQATHMIYSNVDSKIVDGEQVYNCEGFESDEDMKEWTYRKLRGVTYFDDTPTQSTSGDTTQEGADSAKEKAQNDKQSDKGGEPKQESNQQDKRRRGRIVPISSPKTVSTEKANEDEKGGQRVYAGLRGDSEQGSGKLNIDYNRSNSGRD